MFQAFFDPSYFNFGILTLNLISKNSKEFYSPEELIVNSKKLQRILRFRMHKKL